MSYPFGIIDMNDAFNRALEFEEEQDEQMYEEDEKPEDKFIFRLSPSFAPSVTDKRIDASKLILCTDNVSAGFMDAYFLSQGAKKFGVVCGPSRREEENTVRQNSFWDKTCFLYCLESGKDFIVCQSKRPIESRFLYNWVETVFSRINPNHVIVLSSTPHCKTQLENTENDANDILRQLKTDAFNLKTNVLPLEKPNLIRDLPASAMTYCQVHAIPAILYILATESHLFDVAAVKSFAPVLKDEAFSSLSKASETEVKVALKKLCSLRVPDKGVYI